MTKDEKETSSPRRSCLWQTLCFMCSTFLSRQIQAGGVGALAAAEDTRCSFFTYFIVFPIKVPQSQAHDGSVFVERVGLGQTHPINLLGDSQ